MAAGGYADARSNSASGGAVGAVKAAGGGGNGARGGGRYGTEPMVMGIFLMCNAEMKTASTLTFSYCKMARKLNKPQDRIDLQLLAFNSILYHS